MLYPFFQMALVSTQGHLSILFHCCGCGIHLWRGVSVPDENDMQWQAGQEAHVAIQWPPAFDIDAYPGVSRVEAECDSHHGVLFFHCCRSCSVGMSRMAEQVLIENEYSHFTKGSVT